MSIAMGASATKGKGSSKAESCCLSLTTEKWRLENIKTCRESLPKAGSAHMSWNSTSATSCGKHWLRLLLKL